MTNSNPDYSPPDEWLREVTSICEVIRAITIEAPSRVRRWPEYYRLYLELADLYLAIKWSPSLSTFSTPDGKPEVARIDEVNQRLAIIDFHFRAVIKGLSTIHEGGAIDYRRVALRRRLDQYLFSDSEWYQACQAQYCSGRVAADGLVLESRPFLIDLTINPAYQFTETLEQCRARLLDGIDFPDNPPQPVIDRSKLGDPKTFSVTSRKKRNHLTKACDAVCGTLYKVHGALGERFVREQPPPEALLRSVDGLPFNVY
jgi:hypothetical protein